MPRTPVPLPAAASRTRCSEIEVPEIKGLIGHYLRNELVFELDGGGEPDRTETDEASRRRCTESIEVVTVDYANGRADSADPRRDGELDLDPEPATGKVVSPPA